MPYTSTALLYLEDEEEDVTPTTEAWAVIYLERGILV